jgi:hypothetical protein
MLTSTPEWNAKLTVALYTSALYTPALELRNRSASEFTHVNVI